MMHTTVGWHVDMEFSEDERHTRAAAMVRLPDGTSSASGSRLAHRGRDSPDNC